MAGGSMIDIHSHILPGLDDGSPSMEESVAMARVAAEAGTTDIVATPHANLQYSFDPELVERKIAELSQACQGILRIHYGCDFHLHYDNVQDALANPSKYAVNHKIYLLVELSELLIVKSTDEALERMRGAGMVPIITHPERNSFLQRRIDKLEAWVASGCCLQVTAQSLNGSFGKSAKKFSRELFKRGLVHFVASDAHDSGLRPPRLDEARRWVLEQFGAAQAERLFAGNPAAVLAGEPIPAGEIERSAPPRRWWRLLG
jgi:protein-tyrosine phosphatase